MGVNPSAPFSATFPLSSFFATIGIVSLTEAKLGAPTAMGVDSAMVPLSEECRASGGRGTYFQGLVPSSSTRKQENRDEYTCTENC
jgi:hypothetical protein